MQTLTLSNPLMEPVLPMNIRHQLVVIGNGFDRACGLESSFVTFFEPRMEVIRDAESSNTDEWFKNLRASGITAWDLVLHSRESLANAGYDANWADVESAISDVVGTDAGKAVLNNAITLTDEDSISAYSILQYFDFISELAWHGSPCKLVERFDNQLSSTSGYERLCKAFERVHKGESTKNKVAKACKRLIYTGKEYSIDPYECFEYLQNECPNKASERVAQYLERRYPDKAEWDVDSIQIALLAELHELEKAFDEHLSRELTSKPEYDESATELLKEILEVDSDDLMDMATEVTVLDFNYTTPTVPDLGFEETPQRVNIHGILGGDIIFGADGTNCSPIPSSVRFTKTYRALEQDAPDLRGSIAYAPCDGHLGSKETVAIKVYGHSLAQADYSYFQSIFDIVDLYAGSVKLYFLYRQHTATAREDLLLRIANLLNAYGTTMDNRDHGKNLMHRLLLEKRLILQRIE